MFRFKLRRDLALRWTAVNPILESGEPGVEIDTGRLKIGNGVARWNALSYGAAGPVGPVGPIGPAGAAGVAGLIGATGAAGAVGPAGPAGSAGPAGPAGPTGPAGSGSSGPLAGMLTAAGLWYGPPIPALVGITALNQCRYVPFRVAVSGTIDRVGLSTSNPPGDITMLHRVGIYADLNGMPGAKLLEVTTSANKDPYAWVEIAASLAVTPGRYWFGYGQNGTGTPGTVSAGVPQGNDEAPLFNPAAAATNRVFYQSAGVTGALPDPAIWDWIEANMAVVAIRRAP